MDLSLAGKVAIVTGGSRGIGLSIADLLVAEGADIAIFCRDASHGSVVAEALASRTGSRVRAYAADLATDASVHAAVKDVERDFGGIDILVNGAALPGKGGEFEKLAAMEFDRLLEELNVKTLGYLRAAREVAPVMQRRGAGRIINIGGIAAYQTGTIGGGIRAIGVGALTKNLAEELGPSGITVNCIHPGPTLTDRSRRIIEKMASDQNVSEDEIERQFSAKSIIGRFVRPEEIAALTAFLCSPQAAAINGESIELSGGSKGAMRY